MKQLSAFTAKGEDEARRYIAAGTLALRTAGYPADWLNIFIDLLQTRHNIRFENSGCCIDFGTPQEINGFNAVMAAEIEKRFGNGVIERLKKEAQASPYPRNRSELT